MSPARMRRGGRVVVIVAGVVIVIALLVALGMRGRAKENAGTSPERAAADGASASRGGRGAAGADRVIPVLVVPAEARDVPIYLEGLGAVAAYKSVNVRTQVEGRLNRIAFTEGQTVKKGDLLAEVDPRPFTIQLHTAEAALARDQAQLDGAERNLKRYESVRAEHLIPEQQVDDQRALAEQLRGTVKADQAQIENARLQLTYARITSPIDGVTGLRLVDQGNVIHVSDANGIVVVNQIDPIAVLFTLPQDDLPRVARAQQQAPRVVEALSRDGDQLLATGELALIDNQINTNTATMRLKAIFPNEDRTLWPNQFVKVRLRLDVRRGALVVPAAAVQHGQQGAYVYVVDAGGGGGKAQSKTDGKNDNKTDGKNDNKTDGKTGAGDKGEGLHAAMRPVQVESIQGTLAVLSGGLTAGERVVSEGQNQLRPNARVSVRASTGQSGAPGGPGAAGASGAGGASGRRSKRQP